MNEQFPSATPLVRGDGPGLALAHGAGGGVLPNFGMLVDDLANTHTVVGADYPGSGRTPRAAAPLTVDGLADELVRTATDAGLDRFAVLGYSLGTTVAVRAATRYPDRVSGLILTAGFAAADNGLLLAARIWRALLDNGDRRLTATYLTRMALGGSRLNSLTSAETTAAIDGLAEFIPPGSPEQVDLVSTVDVRDDVPGITAPTSVLATTEDALVPPSLSARLADGIPGARYRELSSGHDVGTEAGGEWLAAIREFLDENG